MYETIPVDVINMALPKKAPKRVRELSVGVCLSAHDGRRFIGEQIASMRSQTVRFDELVIFDDCSTDGTDDLISKFRDNRIRVCIGGTNRGHVAAFEAALRKTTADIVLLADQDDVWEPTKIEVIKGVFESDERIVLVHHDLRYVDESGRLLPGGVHLFRYGKQNRMRYLLRQILQPQLFGCGMAVRREIIQFLLPFPRAVYAHDHWMALVAGVLGGVVFLENELTFYRQHGKNLTPKYRRQVLEVILSRLRLLLLMNVAIARRIRSWKTAG